MTATQALRAVVRSFESHVASINALNVFPVPDGDTGTNMHLTMEAAVKELDTLGSRHPERIDELMPLVTRGALMGARGNSGVILYQIIAGINEGCKGSEVLDSDSLVRGLKSAAELAYKAVTNPVEGTMLSVIRAASEACDATSSDSLAGTLGIAREAMDQAVRKTPEQLPVLRQAGVVDAGGQGLLTIFSALERFANGELDEREISLVSEPPTSFATDMHFLDQAEVIHGMEEFGYCINFTVTGDELESVGLRETLDALGQSTVIVGDDSMLKIHTHSEHPGTILEAALTFGELHAIRIDNMKSQTERLLSERHSLVEPYHYEDASHVDIPIGIVAVASGDGIVKALRGMGVGAVVAGGASMNPSTGEIGEAIESLGKSEIILLPNDSNIVASANHAAEISEHTVRVIPTTSIQQGIAALASFNFDASLDENVESMSGAANDVRSLALTRAHRNVEIDGLEFREGEFMGVIDGTPRVTGSEAGKTLLDLLSTANATDFELATVFVGETAEESLTDQIRAIFEEQYPDLELEVTDGGQPHYDLLISLE
ncbi:MAG: DAK2 domain-containing protein [Thermomicrobiaceae bacterium]